jgi:molybdate/tungstate transport system substrate-binding protein
LKACASTSIALLLALCSVTSLPAADNNASRKTISVLYAGSMSTVIEKGLGPAFTKATGIKVTGEAQPSLTAAQAIKDNAKKPDVFISADPQINLNMLMYPANGSRVKWYISLASSELVLAYSPRGKFAGQFKAIETGAGVWYQVLSTAGVRFGRSDPATDPLGYRTLFLFGLAAKHYNQPDLAKFPGDAQNPAQVSEEGSLAERLKSGQLDAAVLYKFQATLEKLPFLSLPPQINLGDTAFANNYSQESYTTASGVRLTGAPIVFTAAIPDTASNPDAAAQFTDFAVRADDLWKQYGFGVLHRHSLSGNPAEVPTVLQRFIMVAHPMEHKKHPI